MTQKYSKENWKFYDDNITIQRILKVIEGDATFLDYAFSWSQTNQGHDYWRRIYHGLEPLTQETIDILDNMLMELGHERKEYDTEV